MAYINGKKVLQVVRTEGVAVNVQANPSGTATETLEKLLVDETIYSVDGGSSTPDNAMSDSSVNAVQNKVIKKYVDDKADTKANIDGYYSTMGVGHSDSALSLDSNVGNDDQTPFNYQTSGGDSDITTGVQTFKKLVGASVVLNQLFNYSNISSKSENGGTITNNNDGSFTLSTESGGTTADVNVQLWMKYLNGHKYFFGGINKLGTSGAVAVIFSGASTITAEIVRAYTQADNVLAFTLKIPSGTILANPITITPMIIDLTQMFGSQVADYIYAKEQANAGDGVAIFKSMFPNDYYAYNTGTFIHSQSAKLKMVDYNQWDEQWEQGYYDVSSGNPASTTIQIRSKNYIKVIPSETYYFKSSQTLWVLQYDSDKNYLGIYTNRLNNTLTLNANTHYIKFYTVTDYGGTYKNDICISLYWDGSRIGYEPYQEHIYDLPNDTLRGVLKVVNNKIIADGDEEYPDGSCKTKYVQITINAENITSYAQEGLSNYYQAATNINPPKKPYGAFTTTNIGKASNYLRVDNNNLNYLADKTIAIYTTNSAIRIRDDSITTLEGFKALCPITLIYKVADDEVAETTSTAFAENIYVDDFGTMEFLDENNARISGIQGNEIFYKANVSGFAESLYVKTDGDVDNIAMKTDIVIPDAPTTDGTYTLKCSVVSGVVTYTWEADE